AVTPLAHPDVGRIDRKREDVEHDLAGAGRADVGHLGAANDLLGLAVAFEQSLFHDRRPQNVSGSVRRTHRPALTTARNDEFARWCLSGPKVASGRLKMSRYPRMDSRPLTKLSSVRSPPARSSPSTVRSAATWP